MSIIIDSANRILIDGVQTGLAVTQASDGTIVYTPEGITKKYAVHKMPYQRYSLAHDSPASKTTGRAQFEADIRALLALM